MTEVYHRSQTGEWNTPINILVDAAIVMGGIDIDPCAPSHDHAIKYVKCFTPEENGLDQEWKGRVFMNPPYGKDVKKWIKKAHHEVKNGHAEEIIILWKASTDTAAFREVISFTSMTCFINGRLKFSGNKDPAPFPSVLFYYGSNPEKFRQVFSKIGHVWNNPAGNGAQP